MKFRLTTRRGLMNRLATARGVGRVRGIVLLLSRGQLMRPLSRLRGTCRTQLLKFTIIELKEVLLLLEDVFLSTFVSVGSALNENTPEAAICQVPSRIYGERRDACSG